MIWPSSLDEINIQIFVFFCFSASCCRDIKRVLFAHCKYQTLIDILYFQLSFVTEFETTRKTDLIINRTTIRESFSVGQRRAKRIVRSV